MRVLIRMNNTVYTKMIDDIIRENNLFETFRNSKVAITGATGLIGKAFTLSLLSYTKQYNANITIYIVGRSATKMEKVFGKESELIIVENNDLQQIKEIDYLLHAAAPTSSKDFVDYPVDTIESIISDTLRICRFADSVGVKKMVYLSSLEVYGIFENKDVTIVDETGPYGEIDILSPRSSYSEGKRVAELICSSFTHQHDTPISIARLTQAIGAGYDLDDKRVICQFARSKVLGLPIILHTEGNTVRNYIDLRDLISALLFIFRDTESTVFNVANDNESYSIKELAKLISNDVIYEIDCVSHGYNPELKINLSSNKLRSRGWKPSYSTKESFDLLSNYYGEELGYNENGK